MNKLSRIFRPFNLPPKNNKLVKKWIEGSEPPSDGFKVSSPCMWRLFLFLKIRWTFHFILTRKFSGSVQLMQNYGLIHHCAPGMYHILPMGQRIVEKLIKVIDREMKSIGAEKMTVPLLTAQRLWDKSGISSTKFPLLVAFLSTAEEAIYLTMKCFIL